MSLLPHHAAELIAGSGIDPAIIASRGYRSVTAQEAAALGFAPSQCRPGLLMPQWTLAGIQVGYLLKPDEPRTVDDKILKYEAPAGSVPHFDMHPDALPALRDPSQTLFFTEGNKKSDAAWSRGHACVALPGVWMFLHGRLVVPDLDEIPLEGRRVRLIFDSDVTRKASVAEAFLRFAEVLRRRGATVEIVYLPEPEGEDGGKTGLDDWYIAGGTAEALDTLARPWDGKGPGVWLRSAGEETPEQLRATITTLMQAIENSENTRADLQLMASVAGQVMHKQRRGVVEATGKVVLSAAEISDDWRPAPAKGERIAPTNPTGTKPRMARERVGGLMGKAVERGLLRAKPIATFRQHSNGTTYKTTDWLIDPVASFAELIDPWAKHRSADPKVRKPRTIPNACPSCGEVHAIRRVDYCTGCGAQVAVKTITPADGASDNLSEAREPSPPPPLLRKVRSIIGGADHNTPTEPDWLADAPDPASDDLSDPRDPDDTAPYWRDLTDVQERLITASHAPTPHDKKQARQDLEDRLAAIARERGRVPVLKPAPLPHMPAEAHPDPWTDEAWL